jgi:hypothetical protein
MSKNQGYNDSVGVRRNQQLPLVARETWCQRIADGNMH